MSKKKQKKVLASLTYTFKLAHLWENFLDQYFKETNITIKQFLLLLTIREKFKQPPSISEVAAESGSSHQNIKQIAVHLKKKEMLLLQPDTVDKRFLRLNVTPSGEAFIDTHYQELTRLFTKVFKKEKSKEIQHLNDTMERLIEQSKKRLNKLSE